MKLLTSTNIYGWLKLFDFTIFMSKILVSGFLDIPKSWINLMFGLYMC